MSRSAASVARRRRAKHPGRHPRRPMCHALKCWPQYFAAIEAGTKRFELRRYDRDFHAGDTLELSEWDPDGETYTGKKLVVLVTYILEGPAFGLKKGWCIMSIAPLP